MNPDEVFIEQFVDEGLGNSAYLVGSHATHTAMLIDALRDVDRYRYAAERLSVRLTHALDTHLHADFVSGARELAAQAGAEIGAAAAAQLGFDHRPLAEGDVLPLASQALRVLATPGHTPEHISFVLTDPDGQTPRAVFSGGALVVGGAARTDLLGHDLCAPLARQLYDTLRHKLLSLPDAVEVYPTHGAGSFCAAPVSSARTTTIGRERRTNRLAQARDENEFMQAALSGLPSYPVYYKEMRGINQRGPRVLGGVPKLAPLSAAEARALWQQGALALDVRERQAFAAGHVRGAYGIPLSAPLITWAGWLVPFGARLVVVEDDAARREEAVRQLIRIGYDNLLGYLEGGVKAWARAGYETSSARSISVHELRQRLRSDEPLTLLDVRQADEWEAGHIPSAIHIENGQLPWIALSLPTDRPLAVQCASGNRSVAGLSVLARRGYTDLLQVEGGIEAWEEAGYEVERE
ncbi:MAG: MBL fold metallo-hydrolase [Anaerolineales bacterium]|nr:MBL fold metallo-hydrolase [Anaerolineales bacterium]